MTLLPPLRDVGMMSRGFFEMLGLFVLHVQMQVRATPAAFFTLTFGK